MVDAGEEDIISNAEILGEIDEGTFGKVYKIRSEDEIEYAAKFIKKSGTNEDSKI